MICINDTESTGRRAALLLEADELRASIRHHELRLQQIEIQVRELDQDDMFNRPPIRSANPDDRIAN